VSPPGDISAPTDIPPRAPRWTRRLHVRFLAVVTAAFLVIMLPAAWILFGLMQQTDTEALTSRIGNLAARTAGAIDRHAAYDDRQLSADLMSPLASDRAFLCAELRAGPTLLAALPAAQGCVEGQAGHILELPVDAAGKLGLTVGFTDAELREIRRTEQLIGASMIALAFLVALLAGGLTYRYLIWRRLKRLTDAILQAAATGDRRTIGNAGGDEIGLVIGAYNDLIVHETDNERRLRESESALAALNQDLEARVRERTAELEIARHMADRANESKTQFLWSMSHELRTPLNAIIGFSEIISRQMFGPIQPPRYKGFADDILFSGQHLLNVINDLLDIARIEVGRETLDDEPTVMAELLAEAIRVVQPLADAATVDLNSSVEDADLTLSVDATKTKQILLNLLSNAIKNTPAGGRVTAGIARTDDERIALRVADTGRGIPAEDLPMVLEPFARASSRAPEYQKGTGLGLPLSRKMAELHGGELILQSTVGTGTVATVLLPASRIVARAPRPAPLVSCVGS